MKTYNKFCVQFTDPDFEIDSPNANDEFHGYLASVPVHMTEAQFQDILEDKTAFDAIEQQYGVLDIDGSDGEIGFCSYEIEMPDAKAAFRALCHVMQEHITGPISERFIGTTETD